jgi:hypothetical protein
MPGRRPFVCAVSASVFSRLAQPSPVRGAGSALRRRGTGVGGRLPCLTARGRGDVR